MLAWVDGQPAEGIPLGDRGLAYGDGLFETIAVRRGRPRLLARHLARLEEGCRRLRLALDLAALAEELGRFSTQLQDGVLKLIVTRGDGRRGYAIPTVATTRRILSGSPFPAYPLAHATQGIALYACATRLAEQPLLAGLKHLNRLEQVMARSEWGDERFAEGLMRDTAGRIVEGVFSNLFIVQGGTLVTPALERCGVAGVMRGALIAAAAEAGIGCAVAELSLERFLAADEVFVCNSVYGIWPVTEYAERRWPVGPLTRRMQAISRRLLEAHA